MSSILILNYTTTIYHLTLVSANSNRDLGPINSSGGMVSTGELQSDGSWFVEARIHGAHSVLRSYGPWRYKSWAPQAKVEIQLQVD